MKNQIRTFASLLCAWVCLTVASSATRANVLLTFSEPDFDWLSQGLGTPYHLWTTGDFWTQTFNGTGQASAGHMDLRLFIDDNILSGGAQANFNVLLNNTVVGALSIPQGTVGAQDYQFNFAPILGPNYAVRILETNTVPNGQGSVSIDVTGQSFLTLVPEPTSIAFVTAAAFAVTRRRPR